MTYRDVIELLIWLLDWGLITIVNPELIVDVASLNQIKVLSYKDKGDWTLETKYNIGKKRKQHQCEKELFSVPIHYGFISSNDFLKEKLLPRIELTRDKVELPEDWDTNKLITSFNHNDFNEMIFDDITYYSYMDCISDAFGNTEALPRFKNYGTITM